MKLCLLLHAGRKKTQKHPPELFLMKLEVFTSHSGASVFDFRLDGEFSPTIRQLQFLNSLHVFIVYERRLMTKL